MYCNIWITYPVHALENRDHRAPGQEYPSGGPQQQNIAIWKAVAPNIDILAPDFYSDDGTLFHNVVAALIVATTTRSSFPRQALGKNVGRYFFYTLGHGAIGFSPFGIDYTNWTLRKREIPEGIGENYALIAPLEGEIAQLNLDGKLQTAVEEPGMARQQMTFGDVIATASFGFPQHDGEVPPGTSDSHGRVLVAQTGPLEFLVTGFDGSVSFTFTPAYAKANNAQIEILRAEEGTYQNGVWKTARIWNGDQTDRGLNFREGNHGEVVRIRLHSLPLTGELAAR